MVTPLNILKHYWGYDSFRDSQESIINAVLAGKDTLALLPTGGGKSICFQVPAMVKEGLCIVVSPLIALMKDQVYNLQRRNIPAAAIHSGLSHFEIDRILDQCVAGHVKLLYLSPERLGTRLAQERISRMKVNLLAIDEAHCISQWGYDFRPAYLQINNIRSLLPGTPTLALTATATPEVVEDIQEKLDFNKKHVIQKSFARQNLAYVVLREEAKLEKATDILQKVAGSAVIYVRNRRKTRETAIFLQKKGIKADYFHAGLSEKEKNQKQKSWIEGRIRVIVSTNAFGMGIDKPDVRSVIHLDLPDSLEAYFQEAGRAGRDGKKAYAVLLYATADSLALQRHIEQSFPDMNEIKRVWKALGSYYQLASGSKPNESLDFQLSNFTETFKLHPIMTYHSLRILEQEGWISLSDAVFIPSSLKIRVQKDQLYDYQLRNKRYDLILKGILRAYQGAFNSFVSVREDKLAKAIQLPQADLQKALHRMSKDGVISYKPQKDKPQIFFLRERIAFSDLMLDQQAINFRKDRYIKRIEAAIAYAETLACRSKQLLSYFGEIKSADCGMCDVCLERHKTSTNKSEFEEIKKAIEQKLKIHPLSIKNLLDSFSPNIRKRVMYVLEFLVDEGFILKNEDVLSWSD